MEERKKYIERTLVSKKYELQEIAEPIVFADGRVDVKVIDVNTGDAATIKCEGEEKPQETHQSLMFSPQCAICLEQFAYGDMIFESSSINADCKHEFHQNCIHQWCMLQTNCPCCRRELLFLNTISILHENDENESLPNDSVP